MLNLDHPIEPQDVLDRAEETIARLRENPSSITAEERRILMEALAEVQQYTSSELMRHQAMQKNRLLSELA